MEMSNSMKQKWAFKGFNRWLEQENRYSTLPHLKGYMRNHLLILKRTSLDVAQILYSSFSQGLTSSSLLMSSSTGGPGQNGSLEWTYPFLSSSPGGPVVGLVLIPAVCGRQIKEIQDGAGGPLLWAARHRIYAALVANSLVSGFFPGAPPWLRQYAPRWAFINRLYCLVLLHDVPWQLNVRLSLNNSKGSGCAVLLNIWDVIEGERKCHCSPTKDNMYFET